MTTHVALKAYGATTEAGVTTEMSKGYSITMAALLITYWGYCSLS